MKKLSRQERFWSKVAQANENGCMLWEAAIGGRYGNFLWEKGLWIGAHRASWMLTFGTIPKHLDVLHLCDVPLCVCPDHLFLGTHTDNMIDKCKKGRGNQPRGEKTGASKLRDEDVLFIRNSRETLKQLSKAFGVSQETVRKARIGKTWKHVEEKA